MVFEVHIQLPQQAGKCPTVSKSTVGELLPADNPVLSDSEITQYLGDPETRPMKIEGSRDLTIPQSSTAEPSRKAAPETSPKPAVNPANDGQTKIPGSWSQKKRAASSDLAAGEALKRILRGR
jgi:hypothetical protein